VLWLNEMQRHLDGDAGRAAAEHLKRVMAVGAMWTSYWHHFTAQGGTPDAVAAARELLTGPHAHHALDAGADDGRVIQRLTGGPELMDAYRHGGLFTPIEHASITAALDARRLGHLAPVPAEMLTAAADGYLSSWERPPDLTAFTTALEDLARGHRPDGSRTDIRGTLTALAPRRDRAGDPAALSSAYACSSGTPGRKRSRGTVRMACSTPSESVSRDAHASTIAVRGWVASSVPAVVLTIPARYPAQS
jgi:hypothetical protein